VLRRRWATGISAVAALLPAVLWLSPALWGRQAPSLRDQGDFFYPLKLYTIDRIRSGEIPLWNPLSGTGEPWLANGQSGVFYPPNLLFLLPSAALAGGLYLLFHFAVAAWGARRFLKQEAVSAAGALVGAAAVAASGFAISLSPYWNHFGGFAYLPGIASVARGGVRSRASVLGLSALIGLQFMAGSPELCGMTLLLAAALAFWAREEFPEPAVPMPRAASLRRFAAGAALGLALAAWVLIPMAELALHSDRRHALPTAEREYGAVGWNDLLSVGGYSPAWFGGGYLATLFLPPFALVAAGASFREPSRRRLALVLSAFALLGVLASIHAPPGPWLRGLPPLDRIRYPAKALSWTFFAVAMLAGLGLDTLRFLRVGIRERVAWGLLSGLALALSLAAPLALPVRAAAMVGSAAVIGIAAIGGASRLPAAILSGVAAAALLVALGLHLSPIARFAPEEELRRCPEDVRALSHIPGRIATPPMSALAAWVLRDGRFDAEMLRRQREALIGYTNLPCRVSTVRTAAPLRTLVAERIGESIGSGEGGVAAGAVSARALWTPFRPERLPSRKLGEFFRAPLSPYRPRLSFLRAYRVEPDGARAWDRVSAGEIDPTREVFLDRTPGLPPAAGEPRALLVARLAEERPERLVAEVTSSLPGLLVLTDLNYPGWLAEEGSRRLPILTADGAFRAVALPAGAHRVVFRYRPVSFHAGAAVSVLTALTLLILWLRGEPVRVGRTKP